MSDRDTYPEGVPCWVDALATDIDVVAAFYARLFGWELLGDEPGFRLARLRGRDVAGVAPLPDGAAPGWLTLVRVADLDAAGAQIRDAGGQPVGEAIDAEPAGRVAVFTDPAGARFGVWEPQSREGAAVVNEPGAWAMSTLVTPDVEAAATFYGAVFGWRFEPAGPMTLVRLPGYVGGEPQQPVPRDVVAVAVGGDTAAWHVDLRVADVDAAAARVAGLGGTVVEPPHDRGGFRAAVLADPEGGTVSISALR
jgi:uncharacterized protein